MRVAAVTGLAAPSSSMRLAGKPRAGGALAR